MYLCTVKKPHSGIASESWRRIQVWKADKIISVDAEKLLSGRKEKRQKSTDCNIDFCDLFKKTKEIINIK